MLLKRLFGSDGQNEHDAGDMGVKFLLEEFNSLRSFKEQSVVIADKRVDYHLALTSAFVAGLGLLSQSKVDLQNLLIIAAAGSVALMLIGLVTVKQVIDRDILIVDYIRAINRIRAYFAEHAAEIQPYLLMPTSYEFPSYKWQSSNRRVPMALNAIAAAAATVLLDVLIEKLASPTWYSLAFGAAAFVVMYILQEGYASRAFYRAETKAKSKRTVSLFESHQGLREAMRE